MLNIICFSLYGPLAASNRVRLSQYKMGLYDLGINLHIQSLLSDDYIRAKFFGGVIPFTDVFQSGLQRIQLLLKSTQFDAAIIHCELLPLVPELIERVLIRCPYIYDFDDAFYQRYRNGKLAYLSYVLGNKFDGVIANAAAVTAGSATLAAYAHKFNKSVKILPSVVDTLKYRSITRSSNTVFTIGWLGSPSTAFYLEKLVEPLEILAAIKPVRFIVVGGKAPVLRNVDVLEIPWSLETEVDVINSFDVGIMPLSDDEWSRGKCAFKLIQYMSCGLPVVASKVGANLEVVTPECGFLVNDTAEWVDAIGSLRDQVGLRQQMGFAGRKRIEAHYSLHKNLPLMASVIRNVVGKIK